MTTYMAKKGDIQRKWFILDAADKPLGHTAALAATILRGKHKTEYTPHVDCGDFVIILNSDRAALSGNKLEQKYYRTHSGWPGGLKEVKYKTFMLTKSDLAMHLAVKRMLPKNKLTSSALKRLKVFKGAEHAHAAQKPEAWTL